MKRKPFSRSPIYPNNSKCSEALHDVNQWMTKTLEKLKSIPFSATASLGLGDVLENIEKEIASLGDEEQLEEMKEVLSVIYSELKESFWKLFIFVYGYDRFNNGNQYDDRDAKEILERLFGKERVEKWFDDESL